MQNRDLNKAYLEEKCYGKLRRLFCILENYTRESRFGGAKCPCIKYVAFAATGKAATINSDFPLFGGALEVNV